jgi:hypothetical protein
MAGQPSGSIAGPYVTETFPPTEGLRRRAVNCQNHENPRCKFAINAAIENLGE